ncbi:MULTISPECIES: polyprenyl synthetase family protein [unclassified Crossiella]|uniref:polyprenyl synthetase family protein n=1 Tax=unclassified Crossiella TaxID=2620835 RepID=UPI001FFF5F76|nr:MULTISPECIES: polyprenyl synthetase family protein [unclassified Crossiella]MCK2238614.1 polyprenyl synthetase family protein [Crossiella sp. S99.2]MCK2251816.1 polyprenyl synthetase family protein [Crossiella sp. S99.1]
MPVQQVVFAAELAEAGLESAIEEFLRTRGDSDVRAGVDPAVVRALTELALAGGKRIRPAFAWWGWRAAGGDPAGERADSVVRALVALELLQCSALVHDDVMDRSSTRRGQPAAQVVFAGRHRTAGWSGCAERFGDGVAILIGDLALAWADDALVGSGVSHDMLRRAWRPWQAMRSEMVAGQYLDLRAHAKGEDSVPALLRVARLKTASYTIERPLQLGAELAGAAEPMMSRLRAFGRSLGVAFQLRDDLLGVFGDPAVTGKPVGDDLREGKRTPLLVLGLHLAERTGRRAVTELLTGILRGSGENPVEESTVDRVRQALTEVGAVDAVERMIAEHTAAALAALAAADLRAGPAGQLGTLARVLTERDH